MSIHEKANPTPPAEAKNTPIAPQNVLEAIKSVKDQERKFRTPGIRRTRPFSLSPAPRDFIVMPKSVLGMRDRIH